MSSLSEDQKKRIEENRKRALEIRAAKMKEAASRQAQQNAGKQKPEAVQESSLYNHSAQQKTTGMQQKSSFYSQGTQKSFFNNQGTQKSSFYNQGTQKSSFNNQGTQKSSFYNQGAQQTSGYKPNLAPNQALQQKPFSNQLNKQAKLLTQLKDDFHKPTGGNNIKCVTGSCCIVDPHRFMVDAPYHQQLIEVFKTIPSKSYEARERKWYFHIEDHQKLITALDQLKPHVSVAPLPRNALKVFDTNVGHQTLVIQTIEENIFKEKQTKQDALNNIKKMTSKIRRRLIWKILTRTKEKQEDVDLSGIDPVLENALMPFQREGVCCGVRRDGKILIADDMGLGKTIQGLALAHYYQSEWPLLIVAPSSVRYSWLSAIRQWLPSIDRGSIGVINNSKEPMDGYEIIIISWDLMARRIKEFKHLSFLAVILDESHFMKNYRSARAKAAMEVCSKARRKILLSGTPALSRPNELHTQIQAVKPSLFPNFQEFGIRYCAGKKNAFGWDFNGCSHMTELQIILEEEIMIRRLKSEVMTQLPEKQRQMVVLDPSSIKCNTREMKTFSSRLQKAGQNGADKRSTLLQYFSETSVAKLPAVKYIKIDGTTSSEGRKGMADRFQVSDDVQVALLSITAASTGITLTAASMVVFAELFWNPGVLCQAEDRAHRIGQRDCVIVQYLVASGTADDYLWPLVQKKLDVLNKAGLSKDNFYKADTKDYKSSSNRSITDYFELDESIFDDADEEALANTDEGESKEDRDEGGSEAKKMKF